MREIKGLAVDPRFQRPRRRRARWSHAAIDAGARRTARASSRCACSATTRRARDLYAACGFEVEGVLRELFYLDGRYVDDVLMALDAHSRRLISVDVTVSDPARATSRTL